MAEDSSMLLVARWRAGDQQAARELFDRYAGRLVGLARGQISRRLAGRLDAEDVVQSAYRSFFAAAKEGDFDLGRSGELWRLLVHMTLCKLCNQVKHHRRAKRAVDREVEPGPADEPMGREPSPLEALALVDEVERVMRELGPLHGRMLELRLQGYSVKEVAAATGRSIWTVRRVLDGVGERLAQEAGGASLEGGAAE